MHKILLRTILKKCMIPIVFFVVSIWMLMQVYPIGEYYETNKSMNVSDYAEVSENYPVTQGFRNNSDENVLLSEIRVILINIPEKAKGSFVTFVTNGKQEILARNEVLLADIVPGEYVDLKFDSNVYVEKDKEYFLSFTVKDADAFPHLIVQDFDSKNEWNTGLNILGNTGTDNTLLITYKYSRVMSWKVNAIKIAVLFLLCFLIYSYINKFQIVNAHAEEITILVCLLSLIPLLILGKYNRPMADDYDYSVLTHEIVQTEDYDVMDLIKAAFKTDMNYYNNWQGLYSSAFVLAFQPGIWGEKYYCLTTPIIMFIVFICIFLSHKMFSEVCCGQCSRKKSLLFTILFSTILIQGLPYAREGLYWFNGAMNYMPFAFLSILNIAIILKYTYVKDSSYLIITSMILSFVISGGNHVTAFANIMFLCVEVYLGVKRKKYAGMASLITAVMGFLIVYFAPGTSIRQELLEKQDVVSTLVVSVQECINLLFRWCNLWYALSILLLLPFMLEVIYYNREKKLKIHPLVVLAASGIILVGMLCVPYYAMGFFGFGRLTNVVWVLFMFMSIVNITYSMMYFNEKTGIIERIYGKFDTCKCLFIIVAVFVCMKGNCTDSGISNCSEAVNELLVYDEAKNFANQLDERYSIIAKYNGLGNEVLTVEPITYYPHLLYGGDIGNNTEEWPNTSYENYYGVKVKISE